MAMLYIRSAAMLAAFVVGYFSPWAACLNGLIRWMIVVMMFLVMLQVKFSLRSIRLVHLTILGANLAVGEFIERHNTVNILLVFLLHPQTGCGILQI